MDLLELRSSGVLVLQGQFSYGLKNGSPEQEIASQRTALKIGIQDL